MTEHPQSLDLELPQLTIAYASGALTPSTVVEHILDDIARRGADGVWISVVAREDALARAALLESLPSRERQVLPLWGVPFSVKDCIDTVGLRTTSACPEFSYQPAKNNPAVGRLLAAGAILIGKTNMDQFATGLVGVRSPYGVARNPFDPAYIPGGSSSGAAVSVSAGLVSFALATDAGGSGRVPAAFNNVVGLKPTRGLISGVGSVAACRSIETLSIFALTVGDAQAAFDVARGYDEEDPFSRTGSPAAVRALPAEFRFGVPASPWLDFFGNVDAAALFGEAVARLERLGGRKVEVDYAPFAEINDLLFNGPWLADRYGALSRFVDSQPEALFPVTRDILLGGRGVSGGEVFAAQQRLNILKRQIEKLWNEIDVIVVPTTGTIYRIDEVAADPVTLNARLGTYTNFVNLADLSAVAVPSGFLPNGLPQGITVIAPAFADHHAAALAQRFHGAGLPLGARHVHRAASPVHARRDRETIS
ncbi:allophanate hydrolase [Bradyrhizobium sp. CER78]|uniref:allophanate hydrolase n=1 Tax=Bradyrhizobium sp. CER78 TaxID=3039162 RepID=UPI00244868EC|nr:allophanate hydrolase [Bradyrhizobium sp. CER78]MDH2384364.1 allophanate hydrolase [Bradyrhizobium sp. CER78]